MERHETSLACFACFSFSFCLFFWKSLDLRLSPLEEYKMRHSHGCTFKCNHCFLTNQIFGRKCSSLAAICAMSHLIFFHDFLKICLSHSYVTKLLCCDAHGLILQNLSCIQEYTQSVFKYYSYYYQMLNKHKLIPGGIQCIFPNAVSNALKGNFVSDFPSFYNCKYVFLLSVLFVSDVIAPIIPNV